MRKMFTLLLYVTADKIVSHGVHWLTIRSVWYSAFRRQLFCSLFLYEAHIVLLFIERKTKNIYCSIYTKIKPYILVQSLWFNMFYLVNQSGYEYRFECVSKKLWSDKNWGICKCAMNFTKTKRRKMLIIFVS